MLLASSAAEWRLHTNTCPSWIEANADARGYYAVQYRDDLLSKLTAGDVKERLNARERVDAIGNADLLESGGKIPANDELRLVAVFHDDPEREVVLRATQIALWPRHNLVPPNLEPNYQKFLCRNFQVQARELGWTPKPGEAPGTSLLRKQLVPMVADEGGDDELAAQARSLAERWFADHRSIDPNVVQPILVTAAYHGDLPLFDRFAAELARTQDKQTREQIITAMAVFRDPASIRAGYKLVVGGKIPFMEGSRLLYGGGHYAATRNLPFEFLQANWGQITSIMPSGGGLDFGSLLPYAGANFCDAESRDRLAAFFKPRVNKFVGAPRVLDEVIEKINVCIAEVQADQASVTAFLAQY